jgi:SAM-dependent methyltransferase
METAGTPSIWASGDAYERYVGRWSRSVAALFLDWLGVAPGGRWLDVGCGTGALTSTVLARADPAAVTGIDPSEGFLAHARARVTDPRASFSQGDATALPVPDGVYDAVVSGLVLNHVGPPALAVAEMTRATRSGGRVAAYVWDYGEGMELIRHFWEAVAAIDPAAAARDQGRLYSALCNPGALAALFEVAGLREADTCAIDVPTTFTDFDDYWSPFLGGQGPAPAYVATLDPDHRDRLRDHLRGRLPVAADGSIALTARAWAVRGTR